MLSQIYAGLSQENLQRVLARGLEMAAKSLSKMVGQDVRVTVDEFRLVPVREVARTLGDPDEVVVGVAFALTGELEGQLSMLMDRAGVLSLADQLLQRQAGATRSLQELEQSAIKETANILSNAFITVVAREMKLDVLLPGPPRLTEAPLGDILESLLIEESEIAVEDRFLLLRHSLTAPGLTLQGNLVMVLKT